MNISATSTADNFNIETIRAWPHRGRQVSLTEDEVREKVASTLETALELHPGQISDDSPIKENVDVDFYRLAGPIMTIENFFRTLLQDEVAREDVSVNSIVDKLMGQTNRSSSR